MGEQERMVVIQRQQHENAQYGESDVNLWNAHQGRLVKETNPMIPYLPLAQHRPPKRRSEGVDKLFFKLP